MEIVEIEEKAEYIKGTTAEQISARRWFCVAAIGAVK